VKRMPRDRQKAVHASARLTSPRSSRPRSPENWLMVTRWPYASATSRDVQRIAKKGKARMECPARQPNLRPKCIGTPVTVALSVLKIQFASLTVYPGM
jgi:hypothetical protein